MVFIYLTSSTKILFVLIIKGVFFVSNVYINLLLIFTP